MSTEGGGKSDTDVSQECKVVTFKGCAPSVSDALECLFEEGSFGGPTQTRPSRTSGDGVPGYIFESAHLPTDFCTP